MSVLTSRTFATPNFSQEVILRPLTIRYGEQMVIFGTLEIKSDLVLSGTIILKK